MKPVYQTNIDYSRLILAPIRHANLKARSRYSRIRIAVATSKELRILTITRDVRITGRKAKRIHKGYFEIYDVGLGWIQLPNDCQIWLYP